MDSGSVEKVRTELDREFRNKGLLAIVNIYFSGADNILAHYAIERLTRRRALILGGPLSISCQHQT
jgi:hypothetical protein